MPSSPRSTFSKPPSSSSMTSWIMMVDGVRGTAVKKRTGLEEPLNSDFIISSWLSQGLLEFLAERDSTWWFLLELRRMTMHTQTHKMRMKRRVPSAAMLYTTIFRFSISLTSSTLRGADETVVATVIGWLVSRVEDASNAISPTKWDWKAMMFVDVEYPVWA